MDAKIRSLIIKLNRLTSEGQIKWTVVDPPKSVLRGTDDHFPLFTRTDYKGKHFALYQARYQYFDMNFEQFFWNERVTLAILDDDDRVLWEEFEQSSVLLDLFDTVRRKVSNLDGLLADLLDDNDLESPF